MTRLYSQSNEICINNLVVQYYSDFACLRQVNMSMFVILIGDILDVRFKQFWCDYAWHDDCMFCVIKCLHRFLLIDDYWLVFYCAVWHRVLYDIMCHVKKCWHISKCTALSHLLKFINSLTCYESFKFICWLVDWPHTVSCNVRSSMKKATELNLQHKPNMWTTCAQDNKTRMFIYC